MVKINSDHPNTLPEHILKILERYWEINLPRDYRNFLLKHNGGEPTPNCFNFKDIYNNEETVGGVKAFFGIYPDESNELLANIKTSKDRIPSHMFPVGRDAFGNRILISVKNPDRGKIYFWDHDMEANTNDGEVAGYFNLSLIADNFNEFLNNLYDYELDEETTKKFDKGQISAEEYHSINKKEN